MPRSRTIDKSKALALPGVKAVLTADDLKPLNLHYMPTLAGDVQAVLAVDKVLFQGQEVAFVVATDRYIAADAVELVEVEYEDLPVRRRSAEGDGRRTPRCCATTSKARPKAPMGRAGTATTSSPGRSATPPRPTKALAQCRRGGQGVRSPISASIPVRWRPAAASPRWTRSTAT